MGGSWLCVVGWRLAIECWRKNGDTWVVRGKVRGWCLVAGDSMVFTASTSITVANINPSPPSLP